MKTVTYYETTDGRRFDSQIQAEAHEKMTTTKEQDLKDAKEALSKALVLLKVRSLENHSKSDDVKWAIEKFLKSATISDDYYTSSDNC